MGMKQYKHVYGIFFRDFILRIVRCVCVYVVSFNNDPPVYMGFSTQVTHL